MTPDELRDENDRLRETVARLNRRAQAAESALHDLERCHAKLASGAAWCGGSLGRAFLAWKCQELQAEIESLRGQRAAGVTG